MVWLAMVRWGLTVCDLGLLVGLGRASTIEIAITSMAAIQEVLFMIEGVGRIK